jgi:hypothetical protein
MVEEVPLPLNRLGFSNPAFPRRDGLLHEDELGRVTMPCKWSGMASINRHFHSPRSSRNSRVSIKADHVLPLASWLVPRGRQLMVMKNASWVGSIQLGGSCGRYFLRKSIGGNSSVVAVSLKPQRMGCEWMRPREAWKSFLGLFIRRAFACGFSEAAYLPLYLVFMAGCGKRPSARR